MELRAIFAANIKRLRKTRGMSQEDLAFESGLHRTYISGIERGIRNVGLNNFGAIAEALDVSPDELLDNSGAGTHTRQRVLPMLGSLTRP